MIHRLLLLTLLATPLAVAAPAHADPVAVEQRLYLKDVLLGVPPSWRHYGVLHSIFLLVRPDGGLPVAGTVVSVSTSSCGLPLQQSTTVLDGTKEASAAVFFNPEGTASYDGPDPLMNAVNRNIGRVLDFTITVTHPGHDAYHLASSVAVAKDMPSCATIERDRIKIIRRSKKVEKIARVGKWVNITDTYAPRFLVTYTWEAGGRVVKVGYNDSPSGTTLGPIKKAWKGKKLRVRISVSDFGSESVSRVIRYGRVPAP